MNKIGENPIYLVICFGGRKEVSTGVFVFEKYWNPLREEIRKSCPNAPVLNKMIWDMKQKVIERKNKFEYEGVSYSPSLLLQEEIKRDLSISSTFKDIMDLYKTEMGLSVTSIKLYDYTYRILKKYFGRDDFSLNEITLSEIKKLLKSLNSLSDNSLRGIMGRIAAIWNYGISKDIVSYRDYPFREFKYNRRYKMACRTYFIDDYNLRKMMDYLFSICIEEKNGLYKYKEGIEEKLNKKYTKEFSLMFFLLSFRFNGSAPVDMALLKTDNINRVKINNQDYWKIEFKRKKTGMPVKCLLKRDTFTVMFFELMLRNSHLRNNFLFPILKDDLTDKQIANAMGKFSSSAVRNLKEICNYINEKTIKDNVEKGCVDSLIDIDNVCLYTARHSFANSYLSSPKASVASLATLMARSPNTIGTYIHQIQGDKQLAETLDNLPI